MHKSKDVYLGYAIVALVFVLAAPVQADPRIEVNANNSFCHAPYDRDNDDNETFLADCGGRVIPRDGVANGYAIVRDEGVPESLMQIDIPGWAISTTVHVTSATGGECVMVDSNNTEYRSTDWDVYTSWKRSTFGSQFGTATYEVICLGGVQQ